MKVLNYSIIRLQLLYICILSFTISISAQTPLHSGVLVSDVGFGNNIGRANTSRNIVVADNGDIYVVFTGSMGIRVAKSIDRGASFTPSVQVFSNSAEPEVIVNDSGDVFIGWVYDGNIMISKSIDGGVSFAAPQSIGFGQGRAVHMAVFGDYLYIIDKQGGNIYSNSNRGDGAFIHTNRDSYVYADIRTDQNGVIYVPVDDPNLYLFKSNDSGVNFNQVNITPPGQVFYSSYALSDGPCGTYMFVGGGGSTLTEGYKIDVETGTGTPIVLGSNSGNSEGRTLFADNRGTFIDGYKNAFNELMINVSYDQGQTFSVPILVANGDSHNVTRNPFHEDIDVVYDNLGQVYLNVYDGLLKNIKITRNSFPVFCPGDTFDLSYELTGVFDPTTEFFAYLSDETGNFENKTLIGSTIANTSGVIQCAIPMASAFGESYRILIESPDNCAQSNIVTAIIGSVILNDPADLLACDDNNGGFYSFDTSNVESEVLGSLINTGLVVSYFDGNGNPLPSPLPNPYLNTIQDVEEITIRVSRPLTSCFSETKLTLRVFDTPIINQPGTIYGCDEGSGFSSFNTSSIENEIIGSQTNLIVRYFDENEIELPSPLPLSYQNTQAGAQTIYVRVENNLNIDCYAETFFDLVVNQLPVVDLEDSYLLCDLEPSLLLNVDPTLDFWEWVYEDGTVVSNNFSAELIDEGNYTVNFGKIENGFLCENSFTFLLNRSELPTIQDIEGRQLSDDNYIEVIATGDGDFEYSIDGVNYQDSNLFTDLLGGVYTVTVRDKNGCGEESRKVFLIDYPKYFTPNNDGYNDVWQIKRIQKYPNAQIRIYDRYGKFIKQISANTDEGWDGTFNGEILPTSDYWFTANFDGESMIKRHFTLKR